MITEFMLGGDKKNGGAGVAPLVSDLLVCTDAAGFQNRMKNG